MPPAPHPSIGDYKSQLTALGNDVSGNRGKMLHLILTLCQKVEKAFTRIVEGGEGGEAAAREAGAVPVASTARGCDPGVGLQGRGEVPVGLRPCWRDTWRGGSLQAADRAGQPLACAASTLLVRLY